MPFSRYPAMLLAALTVLVVHAPLGAHHGAAAFDTNRDLTLTGTVTEWIWANPHSADLKVEERYHRVNANTMELTVTIDDPKVYTARWTPRNKLPLRLLPGNTDLMEMINNPSDILAYKKAISSQTQAP